MLGHEHDVNFFFSSTFFAFFFAACDDFDCDTQINNMSGAKF